MSLRRRVTLELPGETVVLDVPFVLPVRCWEAQDASADAASRWLTICDPTLGYPSNMVNDKPILPYQAPESDSPGPDRT